MNFGKRTSLALIGALLILAASASAQNLILNGDFETGDLTGWEVNGAGASAMAMVQSGDNGPAATGNNNAYLENYAEALGLNLKQATPIGSIEGGTVFYSFDLKLDQADVGGVLFVQLFAEQEGVGIVGGSGLMGPFWPWNTWESYEGSFEAPESTDFVTIQFVATTGAATGTNCVAHVDNVVVHQGLVPVESGSLDSIKALYR